MKKLIVIALLLASCTPEPLVKPITSKHLQHIADNSYFSVSIQDSTISTHNDQSLVVYLATASLNYVPGEDTPIGQAGFVHLEPLAKYNGVYYTMAKDVIPYCPDYHIPFNLGIRQPGTYIITVDQSQMPNSAQITLTDNYTSTSFKFNNKKDAYKFTASPADTASIGDHRFSIQVK